MAKNSSPIFLFCMLTLFLCGASMFLIGFFPDAYVKNDSTNGDVIGSSRPTDVDGMKVNPPKRQYEQIILMVIDALRFDFTSSSDTTPFIQANKCNRLKLQVAIPTVTLPRIKSLMTGTLSNFIDIIRNLGETEQLSDSLVHVLRKNNKIINFAGDRTWNSLFPSEFTRKTVNKDSFFVQDFYEGDNKIKETLEKELNQTDWSFLILHFLGLDHIGHVEGSNSARVPLKLIEMDNVVKEISTNTHFKNRLLLITGDHGMRNGGGHGGSTEEELQVPLVFLKHNCKRDNSPSKHYNQIDLAPTLAILFSIEIPTPSIGRLIPELLTDLTPKDKLYAYFYNAHHLIKKATTKYGESEVKNAAYSKWFEEAKTAHKEYIAARNQGMPGSFYYEQAFANYKRVAEELSEHMSKSLVSFDLSLIGVGLFLTLTITIYTLLRILFSERNRTSKISSFSQVRAIFSLILGSGVHITCQLKGLTTNDGFGKSYLMTILLIIGVYIGLGVLKALQILLLPLQFSNSLRFVWAFPLPILMFFLLSVVTLGSSSFIEYEHHSCHYLGVTCLLCLLIKILYQNIRQSRENFQNKEKNTSTFLPEKFLIFTSFQMLITVRLLHILNAVSNRVLKGWLGTLKDVGLSLAFIFGLLLLMHRLKKLNNKKQLVPCVLAGLLIYIFRFNEAESASQIGFLKSAFILPAFWICILAIIFLAYNLSFSSSKATHGLTRHLQTFLTCSFLIAALLHKPHNVILLPCQLYILDEIYNFCDQLNIKIPEPYRKNYILAYKTLMTVFVTNMFFFYQGNTNSLATIDLNPGYIGQSTYNAAIVGVLVTINTYSAHINGFFYFVYHITNDESRISSDKLTTPGIPSLSSTAHERMENLRSMLSLYTVLTFLPVTFYLCLMILFRYHLFIYSVFAPKVFYECYSVLVYYLNYCILSVFIIFLK